MHAMSLSTFRVEFPSEPGTDVRGFGITRGCVRPPRLQTCAVASESIMTYSRMGSIPCSEQLFTYAATTSFVCGQSRRSEHHTAGIHCWACTLATAVSLRCRDGVLPLEEGLLAAPKWRVTTYESLSGYNLSLLQHCVDSLGWRKVALCAVGLRLESKMKRSKMQSPRDADNDLPVLSPRVPDIVGISDEMSKSVVLWCCSTAWVRYRPSDWLSVVSVWVRELDRMVESSLSRGALSRDYAPMSAMTALIRS